MVEQRVFRARWQSVAATLLLMAAAWFAMPASWAKEAAPAAQDPVLEARVLRIAAELRCLVCQNQTIADSSADLAVDLRQQVREMLVRGRSERQILDYMTDRYGDFVLYRPPLKATTAFLWFGPAALLLGGVVTLFIVLRRRSRMAPDMFEPDEVEPDQDILRPSPPDSPARQANIQADPQPRAPR